MKHVLKFAIAALTLLAVGCGGGGNGPAPVPISSSGTIVANGGLRLEAIVKILPTNLQGDKLWTAAQLANPQTPGLQADLINPTVFGVQDAANIECGEQMVFQLVYYTAGTTGLVRNIVSNGVTFASSDSTNTYGSLASNTGDYIAGTAPTTSPLEATANYQGIGYSMFYDLKIDQVRLLGNVLTQGANNVPGAPLPLQPFGAQNLPQNTVLQFYDASGALVDSVVVQFDGSFRASVPTTAASFTVIADTIPQSYYQSFFVPSANGGLGQQSNAGDIACEVAVQSGLTSGTTWLGGSQGQSYVLIPARVAGQGTPGESGCPLPGLKKRVTRKL